MALVFYRANINPFDVEKCLKDHPVVLDCAVVRCPQVCIDTLSSFIIWLEHLNI